ncbi:MAG: hypothetical protein MPJ78_04945 [Hyphomicrobiaceae bacterium]|nr:hypothetical protein [Hyphomicrobiaceae bacterium]
MKTLSVSWIAGALAVFVMGTPALAGGDPDYRPHANGYSHGSYKGGYAYHPAKPAYAPVYHHTGPTTYTTYPQVSTYSYTYAAPVYSYGTSYAGHAYPGYGYVYRGCRKVRRRWCGCRW